MTKKRELPKKAILVVNAGSRRGNDLFTQVRDKLATAGIELLETRKCKTAKSMTAAVSRAIKRAPMVIIGGGDGSLSSNVDYFIGTDVVFAFLPLGTANSFARTVGMPLDLDGAIDVITNGEPHKIDVGCINGDHFLNAAAMGLAPKVAETVPHGLKRRLGRLGYLVWAGWSAANFNAFRVKLEGGGRTRRLWATEVRIANGRYHGGIELIENADLKSGEIVVQVVTGRSLAKLAWSYVAAAFKLRSRRQAVREFVGREFRLSTRPRLKISIDGEVTAETPLDISAVPDAITIALPRGKPSPRG
jgi:YegS/Rv2252/BmrU family lipid kinase